MTCLVRACTDPITNITGPIYRLAKGDRAKRYQLENLILTTFRTATAVAFFFVSISFNYIFGRRSFAFASQFLIHPYSAALCYAFINVRYPLVTIATDLFVKRQLLLTRADLGGFVRAVGFCYIAKCLERSTQRSYVDIKYQIWASELAFWYYGNTP
jgi:hypothetical protein